MPDPRRLYLHVGLQKTGTSYLQGVMLRNADELADQGLDLVPATRRDAFELMLQVRERYNPERDPVSTADALERFSQRLQRSRRPRALLSQESLAAARPAQVRRLLEACGEHEVHVVLTVRDLARQLPSSWQQELKSGKTDDYEAYLRRLQADERSSRRRSHPWIHLDPVAVLSRWAKVVPPERVHVVTVPPPGSSPTLLLERFCRVLEIDPRRLVPEQSPSNTSLGRVQAEVLRRVNSGLPDELRRRQVYGDVGKRFFSSQVLAAQDARPIRVPAEFRGWCLDVAAGQVAALAAAGYAVEGEWEDLRCLDAAFSEETGSPSEEDVAAVAVAALVRVLTLRSRGAARRRSRGRGAGLTARARRLLRRGAGEGASWDDHDPS